MWLVNTSTRQLEEFYDRKVPEYAILSHTWTTGEMSMHDLEAFNSGGSLPVVKTPGYEKILSACNQAIKDGYQYIWIDTCCIDKKSSAELSEAINSMFRYYKESKVCYAFLADVKAFRDFPKGTTRKAWEEHFARSRWFMRGWTLQELIAPKNLIFFSRDMKEVGSKNDLLQLLSQITGIKILALAGKDLKLFSVAQRISWASKRKTTRLEDEAYCLLGLLEINMSLLYGEGSRAFRRLQDEIIKTTADHSIFAWTGTDHAQHEFGPWAPQGLAGKRVHWSNFFAISPADFADCGNIFNDAHVTMYNEPYFMTNQGLSIKLPIATSPKYGIVAILNCFRFGRAATRIGILLQPLSSISKQSLAGLPLTMGYQGRFYARKDKTFLIDYDMDSGDTEFKDSVLTSMIIPEHPVEFSIPSLLAASSVTAVSANILEAPSGTEK